MLYHEWVLWLEQWYINVAVIVCWLNGMDDDNDDDNNNNYVNIKKFSL